MFGRLGMLVLSMGLSRLRLQKPKENILSIMPPHNLSSLTLFPYLTRHGKELHSKIDVRAAIVHCVWNPINYNLLDHLNHAPQQQVLYLTATDAASNEYLMPPPLPCPNFNAGIGSYYIDLIREEEQKSRSNDSESGAGKAGYG
jgi:hypothetical protein